MGHAASCTAADTLRCNYPSRCAEAEQAAFLRPQSLSEALRSPPSSASPLSPLAGLGRGCLLLPLPALLRRRAGRPGLPPLPARGGVGSRRSPPGSRAPALPPRPRRTVTGPGWRGERSGVRGGSGPPCRLGPASAPHPGGAGGGAGCRGEGAGGGCGAATPRAGTAAADGGKVSGRPFPASGAPLPAGPSRGGGGRCSCAVGRAAAPFPPPLPGAAAGSGAAADAPRHASPPPSLPPGRGGDVGFVTACPAWPRRAGLAAGRAGLRAASRRSRLRRSPRAARPPAGRAQAGAMRAPGDRPKRAWGCRLPAASRGAGGARRLL